MCKEKTTLSGTISSPVVCLDIWLSYLYVLGSVNKQMTSRRKWHHIYACNFQIKSVILPSVWIMWSLSGPRSFKMGTNQQLLSGKWSSLDMQFYNVCISSWFREEIHACTIIVIRCKTITSLHCIFSHQHISFFNNRMVAKALALGAFKPGS